MERSDDSKRGSYFRDLSGGQKQRLSIALIGIVVLAYAIYRSGRGGAEVASGARAKVGLLERTFPNFVLGFIAVSALATAGVLHKSEVASLGNLSEWAFLLCFAGVGLNFDLKQIARAGVRPLIVAALGLVVVAACSLGLVVTASGLLRLT